MTTEFPSHFYPSLAHSLSSDTKLFLVEEEEERSCQLRARGNDLFKEKHYTEALECYTTAIEITIEDIQEKKRQYRTQYVEDNKDNKGKKYLYRLISIHNRIYLIYTIYYNKIQ